MAEVPDSSNFYGSVDTANGGAGIILNLPRNWSDGYSLHLGTSFFPRAWAEIQLGAAFDANGHYVGVPTAAAKGEIGGSLGFLIGANVVQDFLAAFVQKSVH